jgi:hypothetical protein
VSIARAAIVLVVSLAVLGLGVYLLGRPVKCEDRVMEPGDTCRLTRGGGDTVTEKDYEEQRFGQKAMGVVITVVGSLGAIGAVVVMAMIGLGKQPGL